MLEKIILANIFDDTFKNKVDSLSRSCLRSRGERDKCQRCFSLCPEGAISLERTGIKIDHILCSGCNFCVSSCYSRSLTSLKRPYLKAINLIVDQGVTSFGCINSKEGADVSFGCLRTIDPRFLMALFFADLEANINLDFSPCEACSYKDLAFNTKDLIRDFSKRADLENTTFSFNRSTNKDEKPLSRRDFLAGIFNSGKNIAKSSIKETSRSWGLDLETKENVDTIIKILLKRGLNKKRGSDFMMDYIFDLEIKPTCDLCQRCVAACPSGALFFKEDNTSQGLGLDLVRCNFCGRCLERCSSASIEKAPLKSLEARDLYKKEKTFCKSCKSPTSDLDQEGLCPTCQIRRKNRRRVINRR